MSVLRRLFSAESLTQPGAAVCLDPSESHHGARVLRLNAGDPIAVFDASGRQFRATVDRIEHKRIFVLLGEPMEAAPETPKPILLYLAAAKGPAFEAVLQRAVELGVAEIVPFIAHRSVPRGDRAAALEHKVARWRHILLSATKQCGRAHLTAIAPPRPFAQAVEQLGAETQGFCCVSDPSARRLSDALRSLDPEATRSLAVMIGPEGGLAPDEIAKACDTGWNRVSLGPRILRVETAATSSLTLLAAALGEM